MLDAAVKTVYLLVPVSRNIACVLLFKFYVQRDVPYIHFNVETFPDHLVRIFQ
jgi:hypothetical protein